MRRPWCRSYCLVHSMQSLPLCVSPSPSAPATVMAPCQMEEAWRRTESELLLRLRLDGSAAGPSLAPSLEQGSLPPPEGDDSGVPPVRVPPNPLPQGLSVCLTLPGDIAEWKVDSTTKKNHIPP